MNILIAEDDTISRKAIKTKLSIFGTVTDVTNGIAAVNEFDKAAKKKAPFDLIILDISMPDLDGAQVLSILRKKEKTAQIPRKNRSKIIMVTAAMRRASIRECISLGCNAYITKPLKAGKLYEELERLGFDVPDEIKGLKEKDNAFSRILDQIINRFNRRELSLPVLPHIVKEIQALQENPDPSIEQLTRIIEKDAVISAKLIQVSNSALFKGVDKVSTLNAALVRLGIKQSLSIVATVTSKEIFCSNNSSLKVLLDKLWLHSLATACCCKLMAEDLSDGSDEGVFLLGVIHDIGKVLLLKAMVDIQPDSPLDDPDLLAAIHEIHTAFGALLIKKWGFSNDYITAVERHHWTRFPEDAGNPVLILHVADTLAAEQGFPSLDAAAPGKTPQTETRTAHDKDFTRIIDRLAIPRERLDEIGKTVQDTMLELSDSF